VTSNAASGNSVPEESRWRRKGRKLSWRAVSHIDTFVCEVFTISPDLLGSPRTSMPIAG
jgi:hypothetical protein